MLGVAVWLLVRLKVLPSLYQRAPLLVGMAVVAPLFPHRLVALPLPPQKFPVAARGHAQHPLMRRLHLSAVVVVLWLLPLKRMRRACVLRVHLRVFVALAVATRLSLLRGARKPVAKLVLITVVALLLLVLILRRLIALPRTLPGVEKKLVERFSPRQCRPSLLVVVFQDVTRALVMRAVVGVTGAVYRVDAPVMAGLVAWTRPLPPLHHWFVVHRQSAVHQVRQQ